MNILTYLQNKTKADDWTIRLTNGLMVAGVVLGTNLKVALSALDDDGGEEMERRRRDLLEEMGDSKTEDDDTTKNKTSVKKVGRIYVLPGGRLKTVYEDEPVRPKAELTATMATY